MLLSMLSDHSELCWNYTSSFHKLWWGKDAKLVSHGGAKLFNSPQLYLLDNILSLISLKSSGSFTLIYSGLNGQNLAVVITFDPNQVKTRVSKMLLFIGIASSPSVILIPQ
jgi:hypothetical protein